MQRDVSLVLFDVSSILKVASSVITRLIILIHVFTGTAGRSVFNKRQARLFSSTDDMLFV